MSSAILQPVIDLQNQLDAARNKAIEMLLKQREGIDAQLKELGHKTRGRPRQTEKK